MIKFLFINAIDSDAEVETRYPSLGIGYLISALKVAFGDSSFQFRVVVSDIEKHMRSFSPDIVGISVVSHNYGRAVEYAGLVKKFNVPVLIGGVHITALPATLSSSMDVGCLGEGEVTIVDLMRIFMESHAFPLDKLSSIPGIIYRDASGALIQTKPRDPVHNLDSLPPPDRDALGMFSPHTYMFTSRGCPYRCCFCASSRFWNRVRFFSAERVVDEIETVVTKYGAKFISFYDDLFVADKARLFKIAELMEKNGKFRGIKFSCSLRATSVTPEIVQCLKRMGVVSVGMGLESGNQRILTWLKGSGISVSANYQAVKILREHGIMPNASFVIGSPDETEAEVMDTLRFIKSSGLALFDVYPLTPFPGTPVWELAKRRGLVSESADMNWAQLNVNFHVNKQKAILLSDVLSREDIVRLYNKFSWYRRFHNFKVVWRHPMLADVPRYVWRRARERLGACLRRVLP